MSESLLKVENLKKYYEVKQNIFAPSSSLIKAVDDVSLEISEGETLGLVGESGCGKSTLGRVILKLEDDFEGNIWFEKEDITKLNNKDFFPFRKKMQIIFQDPFSSLNPKMKVEKILYEPFEIHCIKKETAKERIAELLDIVGLREDALKKYPHEFSGGQRQRICIARALALLPKFVVADEPVSALDVSIQAQILNLLNELQEKYKLTYLFISHDLRVVEFISKRVAIMFFGKIVELAESKELYKNPLHPYTQILLASIPGEKREKMEVKNETKVKTNVLYGCRFIKKCPYPLDKCNDFSGELIEVEKGHFVACCKLL